MIHVVPQGPVHAKPQSQKAGSAAELCAGPGSSFARGSTPSAHDDDDEADDHEGRGHEDDEDDEGHGPEDLEVHRSSCGRAQHLLLFFLLGAASRT